MKQEQDYASYVPPPDSKTPAKPIISPTEATQASQSQDPPKATDANKVLTMLVKSMRDFEDIIFYKDYRDEEERAKLENIVESLRT
jgi:hypothetical protein